MIQYIDRKHHFRRHYDIFWSKYASKGVEVNISKNAA